LQKIYGEPNKITWQKQASGDGDVFEVSELLGQSNVIRGVDFGPRRRAIAAFMPWVVATFIATAYLAFSVIALKNPSLDGWAPISGPGTWTGMASMSVILFVVVGGALTASQWTMTRGGRRRYRSRQRRLLDV
jgi:hypothetical protein